MPAEDLRFPLLCSRLTGAVLCQASIFGPCVSRRFTVSSSLFARNGCHSVPAVDFRAVRELISMADVLNLIGCQAESTTSGACRGPCPIHRSHSTKSRSFAVHVALKVYRCFVCGSAGNHLDLYAAVTSQGIYHAAIDLCEKLHREVPWLHSTRSR